MRVFVGMVEYTDSIEAPNNVTDQEDPKAEDEFEYKTPQNPSNDYEVISTNIDEKSAYSHPVRQHEGFVGMVEYTDSVVVPNNVTNQVKQKTEHEFGYTIPQNPSNDYEIVSTYTDDKSAYSHTERQCEGFVGMVEYIDSAVLPQNVTNQAEQKAEDEVGYTIPQNPSNDKEVVSTNMDDKSAYSHRVRQLEGFVGMVEYTHSIVTPKNVTDQEDPKAEDEFGYKNTSESFK